MSAAVCFAVVVTAWTSGPAMARASTCPSVVAMQASVVATAAAEPSGDLALLGAQLNGALTKAGTTGSEADIARAIGLLSAIRPCSATGLAQQQSKIEFLGYRLAAEACHKIVEGDPTFGGVDSYLVCVAPINAAAVRLEHVIAQRGSDIALGKCRGQGVSGVTARKAIASIKRRVAATEKAAGALAAMASVLAEGAGAIDETGMAAGYNEMLDTIEKVQDDVDTLKQLVGPPAKKQHARAAGVTRLSASVPLWRSLVQQAGGFAAKFRSDLARVRASRRADRSASARTAAGLAQLHADQAAIALESAIQVQGHFPEDLKSDTALAAPVSQKTIDRAKKRIAAAGKKLSAGAKSVNIDALAGRTLLSLLDDPMLVESRRRLVTRLKSLNPLSVVDSGRS